MATTYDGYPMHKKGETLRALGIGAVGSFIGTFGSILIATIFCPYIANLAVMLGPWEYFSLCVCAISFIASFSRESMLRGFASAFIGIGIACIGAAPVDGTSRFTFGNYNLLDGVDITAMILGLYAIKEVLLNTNKEHHLDSKIQAKGIFDFGVKLQDIISNVWNIVRSFCIGLFIGFLPGVGSGLSNMVAYAQAKNGSKHPEEFGKGTAEGLFASEVSNNASIGGAVIPMIALGIPGDSITAILLGALTLHGLTAGPLLLVSHPDDAYFIFAAILVAAVLVLLLQLLTMRWFPRILQIPYHYLYSVIVVVCFVGAYISTNTMFNVYVMLVFAVVAILFDKMRLSTTPMILGFLLGPMLEQNFRRGISYSTNGAWAFLTRPVSFFFLMVAFLLVFGPYVRKWIRRIRNK
ncbi:MAG: tripartite tricarboxylate transporter permease [Lachnospiraceae bacterium]|nr:tripartite tricarboxylate transporter permease [Lachnospiraceae bacterium]